MELFQFLESHETFKIIVFFILIILAVYVLFSYIFFLFKYYNLKRRLSFLKATNESYNLLIEANNQFINDLKERNDSLDKELDSASIEIKDFIKLSIKNEVNLKRSIEKLNADLTCAIADRDRHKHNFNELAKSKGMVNFFSNENLLEKNTSVTSNFSQALEKVADKLTDNHCLFCETIIYPGKHFCGRVHQRAYQKNGFQSIKQTVINRFNKSNRYKYEKM